MKRYISIITLGLAYLFERDADERVNIINTLKEIIANEPIELPEFLK